MQLEKIIEAYTLPKIEMGEERQDKYNKEGGIFLAVKVSSGTGTISEINNPVNPGSTGFTYPKIDPPDIVYEQNYARRIIGISYETVVHTVHPLLYPLRAFILE